MYTVYANKVTMTVGSMGPDAWVCCDIASVVARPLTYVATCLDFCG